MTHFLITGGHLYRPCQQSITGQDLLSAGGNPRNFCTQEVEREINSQKLFYLNIFIVLSVEDQRVMVKNYDTSYKVLPWWLSGQESACNAGDTGSIPGLGRSPGRRAWQLTPAFLPGESPWTEEPGGL